MMFFDGYIAAPPTITVFSAAKLGAVAFIPRLSANTAAPAKARAEIRFMALSVVLFAVPSGETSGATEGLKLRMQTRGHRFVSLPVPITGPVGRPVVEPPGGSSETANTEVFFASPA